MFGREGGREGGLKRKSGVFSIFDMQATGCSVQQLRKREPEGKEREREREISQPGGFKQTRLPQKQRRKRRSRRRGL